MRAVLTKNKITTNERDGLERLLNLFISSDDVRFEVNLEHTNWEESDIRELVSKVLGCSIIEFEAVDGDNRILYFNSFNIGDIEYQYVFTVNNPEIFDRVVILERI